MRGSESGPPAFTELKRDPNTCTSLAWKNHIWRCSFSSLPVFSDQSSPPHWVQELFSTPFQLQIQPADMLAVFNAPLRDSGSGSFKGESTARRPLRDTQWEGLCLCEWWLVCVRILQELWAPACIISSVARGVPSQELQHVLNLTAFYFLLYERDLIFKENLKDFSVKKTITKHISKTLKKA